MVSNQVATLGFYSNSVINKLQQQVAERLGKSVAMTTTHSSSSTAVPKPMKTP
jgi:hypothetical protein